MTSGPAAFEVADELLVVSVLTGEFSNNLSTSSSAFIASKAEFVSDSDGLSNEWRI